MVGVIRMSSPGKKHETDEQSTVKIGDCDNHEIFFVIDEVGSEDGNEVSSGDEPQVLFIKGESCQVISENSLSGPSDNAYTAVKEAQEDDEKEIIPSDIASTPVKEEQEDDEPEIIFSSENPVVSLPVLRSESANTTPSATLTTKNDRSAVQENVPPNDNKPGIIFFEDASGMFCLDTTPEESKEKPMGPRFTREFSSTLKSEEDAVYSTGDGTKQDNRCFNCSGDHTMMNCPFPKNQKEISKNRSMFLKHQPRMNRYHVDKPSKFDHFTPGVISKELRNALGLRSSDIPLHVYQMRILGYPPGWIEHIKQYSSGLEMIDFASATSSSTEGIQKVTYDYDGIIDYPGFNVPVDRGVRDEWRYLNFPPMQDYNSKEVLIGNLKMHNNTQINSTEDSGTILDIIDMDTSIEDLEEQRKALLAELDQDDDNEENDVRNPTIEVSGDFADVCSLEESQSKNPTNEVVVERSIQTTNLASPLSEELPVKDESTNIDDQNLSPKKSKLLAMGTPVSIRYSPYNTLPPRDKFAQNGCFGTMGELELYENLPNSTGAFQKMRSLLQKVRKVFNKK